MKIITHVREMAKTSDDLRRQGKRIGFVPTMGFLHEGHLSLVRIAKGNADVAVMSIFVNPMQFGPTEDFSKYPRDPERDSRLAESCGTDILFLPTNAEMYPPQHRTSVEVEELTSMLEGKSRPTHFRGVTTVVAKLFNIVKPDCTVFGQKDAQQCAVVRQMVRDLNFNIEVIVAPIVREADGLAMSSRNAYLSSGERRDSTVLYRSLELARELLSHGERRSQSLIAEMKKTIARAPSARVDYVSVADASTLEEIPELREGESVLISLAVFFGSTRLIDNVIVRV